MDNFFNFGLSYYIMRCAQGKQETIELAYYNFETGYEKLGDIFSRVKKVKKDENWTKINRILTGLEINFKDNDAYFEINIYSLVYLYFAIGLLNLGMSFENVKKQYKYLLKSWEIYHYWKYLFAFYIYQAMAGYQVNFYIHKDFCLLLTAREFEASKALNGEDNDLVIINLNNIISSLFHKDYSSNKDNMYHLNEQEQSVLFELNFGMYEKSEIRIKMKDWKIKELEILGKEMDLSKTKKLEDSIPHGEITKKRYKGQNRYIKIREIKDLENDKENK